jgi:hypothetical protein
MIMSLIKHFENETLASGQLSGEFRLSLAPSDEISGQTNP